MRRAGAVCGTTAAALALLSGCGAAGQEDAARAAAERFEKTLGTDARTACGLLAPQTRETLEKDEKKSCEQALPGVGLEPSAELGEARVAGHSAQVKAGKDTLFLAYFDDGWKVTAAGCEQKETDPEIPYDCQVKGD